MSNAYTFDVTIPRNASAQIQIDTKAGYGYWERADGSEGGGLWFDKRADGTLDLTDYDGAYELPKQVVALLHERGYILASELESY